MIICINYFPLLNYLKYRLYSFDLKAYITSTKLAVYLS